MGITTTSAARLSARHAEDQVAADAPVVRFVGVLSFSSLALASDVTLPLTNNAVLFVPDLENGERSQAPGP